MECSPFDAVLLLSFGGPEGPEQVRPFLENVTRGRGVPPERLDDVAKHYLHFGGVSPINGINRALAEQIRAELSERRLDMPVYFGNRNWHPYVEDAVAIMCWLLHSPGVCGIFNVGTGRARSFRDLITTMFNALGKSPNVEYIDMPTTVRKQYQYFTQANVENLRRAGYNAGFTSLEDGVARYVTAFLSMPDRYR